uniref:Uncharacterized protein n=1 Tax=Ciona savignyi TaxID=51511 RepID=H2ZMZ6_CIOSA
MDRKKKEKKFVTGSVSPVTTQANKAAKTASGQSTAVVNTPGGRGLFAPIKSASITNKSTPTRPAPGTPTSPKQTNPVTQTKGGAAPAARHRKSSIKDVVEMLHAGQAHVTKTTTSNTLQRNTSVQAPGAVMKSYDRQTSSVDAASKSKPSFPPQSKPPSSLSPKLGGKSPAGSSSGKASVSSKPTFNKTTNVAGKHGGLVNRANIIRKDPKIKSSAREGQIPVSKSPPKTP